MHVNGMPSDVKSEQGVNLQCMTGWINTLAFVMEVSGKRDSKCYQHAASIWWLLIRWIGRIWIRLGSKFRLNNTSRLGNWMVMHLMAQSPSLNRMKKSWNFVRPQTRAEVWRVESGYCCSQQTTVHAVAPVQVHQENHIRRIGAARWYGRVQQLLRSCVVPTAHYYVSSNVQRHLFTHSV